MFVSLFILAWVLVLVFCAYWVARGAILAGTWLVTLLARGGR
jgi:hypothetical protein